MIENDFSSPLEDSSQPRSILMSLDCMPPLLSPRSNLQRVIVMLYGRIQGRSFQSSWIHLNEPQGEDLDTDYGYGWR